MERDICEKKDLKEFLVNKTADKKPKLRMKSEQALNRRNSSYSGHEASKLCEMGIGGRPKSLPFPNGWVFASILDISIRGKCAVAMEIIGSLRDERHLEVVLNRESDGMKMARIHIPRRYMRIEG